MDPNIENIRKWVEALESGYFEQGRGALAKSKDGVTSFCCLGVACEVALANGVDLERYPQLRSDGEGVVGYGPGEMTISVGDRYSETQLPLPVAVWLGTSNNPNLPLGHGRPMPDGMTEDDVYCEATTANDSGMWSFREIAAALRERYLGTDVVPLDD